jgi:hypothetical protein
VADGEDLSVWTCEDCYWRWPLKNAPYQDSECDRCGGTMVPLEPDDGRECSRQADGTWGQW